MTTYELAEILLSQEETIFKFGHFVSNSGDTWWEELEYFKYTFGEEGFVLEEENTNE